LEINFESAIERAKELDTYFRQTGKLFGPLHGLPMTLKDQFHVKGLNTTMGYVGWINTFEGDRDSTLKGETESELVRELESLGAVIIGKVVTTGVQRPPKMKTSGANGCTTPDDVCTESLGRPACRFERGHHVPDTVCISLGKRGTISSATTSTR
jgi:hypothetical protein